MTILAAGWFHQGGGWNQNSRLDQIRSIVEHGELHINSTASYRWEPDGAGDARIIPVPYPVPFLENADAPRPNTGDLAFFAGRMYPNKPPGVTFLAVPGYWMLVQAEGWLGIDRNSWSTLTCNAWLTCVLSVGVLAALGAVAFLGIVIRLGPDLPPWTHWAAALSLCLSTLYWPFSTMLFDHVPVASLLMIAIWLALRAAGVGEIAGQPSSRFMFALLAGLACGWAVLTNYAAVLAVLPLSFYVIWTLRNPVPIAGFLIGGSVVALLLGGYHWLCFGNPLTLANSHQFEIFNSTDASMLGVFGRPRLGVMIALLLMPHRGLFFTAPVLVMGVLGMGLLWQRRSGLTLVALAIMTGFLVMNGSFNAWNAGYTVGPRYLIPAIPFFALPLAFSFNRWPRTTAALSGISIAIAFVCTAVDPQAPARYANPLIDYELPTFLGNPPADSKGKGVISVNTQGMYEIGPYVLTNPSSIHESMNSLNAGELFAGPSRWSLMPLVALLLAGSVAGFVLSGRLAQHVIR